MTADARGQAATALGGSASPPDRLRVLLSAYACEPGKGSEPGVGWNWALQASRHHDVWVLTRANNRASIAAGLEGVPPRTLRFIYYDLPPWARFWKRGSTGIRAYYILWQLGALFVARRLHRAVGFHVAHHVTFNTMEVPGFLWLLPPAFVWGPVGGGQEPETALRSYFGPRWYRERLRVLRKRLARFNPMLRLAAARAQAILVANADTAARLKPLGCVATYRELETAVDLPSLDDVSQEADEFTILWAGGLIWRKGPALAVDALARLKQRGVAFHALFIGKGPLRKALEQHISALGLNREVTLHGHISHRDLHAYYRASHVFLFSSLHDTSGNVVLEAMAHARPVVTLDHHGAGEIVSSESGIKVPVVTRAQVIDGLASALERLARDPDLRHTMGRAARARVASLYGWDHKGDLLRRLYRAASAAGQPAPPPTPRDESGLFPPHDLHANPPRA
jgi:glycosyltransferase involved in cell wall biosynthesis